MVRQLLICLETGGHGFHDIADGVLSHSNFGAPDIWYDAQIERPCVLHSLGSLRQPKLEEPHWIGFSAVGAVHICGVVLRLIDRPPLRVLVGPSQNSATSVPSSCCLITRSSTYAS